jgi:hypothetical protein
MNDRARQLVDTADRQICELEALLASTDEAALDAPCPGRENLGDGTVAGVAQHTTDTYLRIAGFLHGDSQPAHTPAAGEDTPHSTRTASPSELSEHLAAARGVLEQLANLTDEQLDRVPPADQARFCDGQRTLEQVLSRMLKHQSHQIDALRAAIA